MPLPTTPTAWPPKHLEHITPVLTTWSAWWTGDPTSLTNAYQRNTGRPATRPSQQRGGVVGALARFWWGRASLDLTQGRDQTHVPLAADIARTSADLLFSEPPGVKVDDKTTQGRLEDVLSDSLFATLTGAAETGAALGGVYLRVVWDHTIANEAFITVVPADEAVPELAWGRLRAVTFWSVVATDGQMVTRHLERHELNTAGLGLVQHGLYVGTAEQLGRAVPLAEHPSTAPLAMSVDALGFIVEGRTPGLAVVYIPNTEAVAAKAFRAIPAAKGWGASDLDGVEPMLDNLDEAYASWMRDLRLGKARLLVAKYMLDDLGAGYGAAFNQDAEVFTALKMAASEDGDAPITEVQFDIRYAEHQATVLEWTNRIIRSAGYSTGTFGENGDIAATATEVIARERRTLMTRGRKIRLWRPALAEIITKLITVDADVFKRSGMDPTGLKLEFPDGIWESPLQAAQTAQALSVAGAASTRTLVALAHPDWDEDVVDKEAALILAEKGTPVADPFALGQ